MMRDLPRNTVSHRFHEEETEMFNNVLVGVDDDEGGRDAIALAQMLAAMRPCSPGAVAG
jgi:hypothetical protein